MSNITYKMKIKMQKSKIQQNEKLFSFRDIWQLEIGNFCEKKGGFTLIELLVVMMVIAILIALSGFGIQNARESARDASRKSDLETIRSALEIYRSDCNVYPSGSGDFYSSFGQTFADNDGSSCGTGTNIYIQDVPRDPLPASNYYYSSSGTSYELCSYLEGGGTCTGACCSISCGPAACNYRTTNP